MITIIVPVFNAELFLKSCLDSILLQSYRDFELILIDDGSSDKSAKICDSYAVIDERIIVIHKKNNEGAGAARNDGLKMAKGDYIGFVDSDDYIDVSMYATLYEKAVTTDADIVQCGYEKISPNGKVISQSFYEDKVINGSKECFKEYCKGHVDNYSPCKLYRKQIVNDVYFGDFHYSEDAYFNIQAFLRCNRLVVVKECFYKYVQTENSACRRPFNRYYQDTVRAGQKMYEMCYKTYPEYSFYFARYIAMWAKTCYIGLKKSDFIDKDSLCTEFLLIFKQYYGKSKIFFPFSMQEFLLLTFRISPYLYQQFQTIIKKSI